MSRTSRRALALFLLGSLAGTAANAQEEEGWSFGLSGYAWLAGLKGEVATLPGLPAAEVDVSAREVVENLDFGLMAMAEARRGRFGLVGEIRARVDRGRDGWAAVLRRRFEAANTSVARFPTTDAPIR